RLCRAGAGPAQGRAPPPRGRGEGGRRPPLAAAIARGRQGILGAGARPVRLPGGRPAAVAGAAGEQDRRPGSLPRHRRARRAPPGHSRRPHPCPRSPGVIMSLTSASVDLSNGQKTITLAWDEARLEWNDPVSRDFEELHWTPLDNRVR